MDLISGVVVICLWPVVGFLIYRIWRQKRLEEKSK
ncbi:hypothetical protein ES705_22250 [subsurface metagenome]